MKSIIFLSIYFFSIITIAQNRITRDSELTSYFDSDITNSSRLEFFIGEADTIVFDSTLTFQKDTELNFVLNPAVYNIVMVRNKTFKDIKNIKFSIEKSSSIELSNCKFINCGTIYFEFGEEQLLYNKSESKVTIKNCDFIDTNLKNDNEEYSYQLYFRPFSYSKNKNYHIGNVEISDCHFSLIDTLTSFLTKNQLLPSRYSVFFFRRDNNVSINDITLHNNEIEFNSPHYRTFGIVFSNDKDALFRKSGLALENQYLNNNNLNIQNNILKAISNEPGHAIFVQGPYERIRVIDNEVLGFGANFLNQHKELQRDGAIHIYGGRESHYSNDLKDINVSYNKIDAVGTAINLSGFRRATANNNVINILPDPPFYSDSLFQLKSLKSKHDQAGMNLRTGNYTEKSGQSTDLTVENNFIQCNAVDRCLGIEIVSVKNFIIKNNVIQNPNNYGIIYHSNKGLINQEFGNSIIEGNLIDFGNQSINSLKSDWFMTRYSMQFAGINISRDFSLDQEDISYESLTITNNKIKMTSNSGVDPIRIEKIESRDGIVKSKNYNIEYNFSETEKDLKQIPAIIDH